MHRTQNTYSTGSPCYNKMHYYHDRINNDMFNKCKTALSFLRLKYPQSVSLLCLLFIAMQRE